jgi:hypothetical protein
MSLEDYVASIGSDDAVKGVIESITIPVAVESMITTTSYLVCMYMADSGLRNMENIASTVDPFTRDVGALSVRQSRSQQDY